MHATATAVVDATATVVLDSTTRSRRRDDRATFLPSTAR
jgi:hypothetical protein